MSQKTAGTALRVQSLLNPTRNSEDAESTGGNSKHILPNAHSLSKEDRGFTASTHVTSGSRSTAQPFGPGRSMPATLSTTTTSIGFMAPLGGSSLVNSSQAMNSPYPVINKPMRKSDPKQPPQVRSLYRLSLPTPGLGSCQPALKFNASSAETPYEHQVLQGARLQSMGSQPVIDAARGSPLPASIAAVSQSQPSMASPEVPIHPPPTTTLSPRNAQWIQDPPTHPQGMQPYLGTPPSENAAPLRHMNVHVGDMRAGYFGVDEGQSYIALPGSKQVLSVPVDLTRASKDADKKRERNAEASRKHRKTLKELHEEKKKWEQDMKELEEDRNFYRNIVKRTPSLSRFVRPLKVLSQTSNTAATKHQGSPDERQSKRRRIKSQDSGHRCKELSLTRP